MRSAAWSKPSSAACGRQEDAVPDSWAIVTAELRKSYGSTEALCGLSLQVSRGSIHGFLGRKGAGKTETSEMLRAMTQARSGEARWLGLASGEPTASVEIRRRTGFVSEDKDLLDYMTVEQAVRFTAYFYPRWRADLAHDYLRSFELPADRKVKTLSRGMRTKLALLLA